MTGDYCFHLKITFCYFNSGYPFSEGWIGVLICVLNCGQFVPALKALEKCVDVKPLISAVYPFNKALEAFEKAYCWFKYLLEPYILNV